MVAGGTVPGNVKELPGRLTGTNSRNPQKSKASEIYASLEPLQRKQASVHKWKLVRPRVYEIVTWEGSIIEIDGAKLTARFVGEDGGLDEVMIFNLSVLTDTEKQRVKLGSLVSYSFLYNKAGRKKISGARGYILPSSKKFSLIADR